MTLGPNQKNWIAALRSGQYEQGSGTLERVLTADESAEVTGHCYCCLGVACKAAEDAEISVDRGLNERLRGNTLIYQDSVLDYLGLYSTTGEIDLSGPYHRRAGLQAHLTNLIGEECPEGHPTELILLNDDLDLTFEQIADVLETFPDLYFKESK